jgi:hypothetical protein
VVRGCSPGGPQAVSEEKNISKIASDTERMKHAHMLVSSKIAFVGSTSTESRRVSTVHNFVFFNNYFIKYFKLVYGKM